MVGQLIHIDHIAVAGRVIDQQVALESLPNGTYILNVKSSAENKAIRFVVRK